MGGVVGGGRIGPGAPIGCGPGLLQQQPVLGCLRQGAPSLLLFSLLLINRHSPLLTNKQLLKKFPLTMNRTVLYRTVTLKPRYVPNRDFCVPFTPHKIDHYLTIALRLSTTQAQLFRKKTKHGIELEYVCMYVS